MNKKQLIKYLIMVNFKIGSKKLIPYDYQIEIAKTIFFREHKRIIISATTRAGKTFIIALTSILYAEYYKNQKIILIAPRIKQARILMNYISEHLTDSDVIRNGIAEEITRSVEGLRQELSKEKITFKNGSSIQILSAEGTGARLMGEGGDLIIVDQSEDIKDEVFNGKIMRMLGDSPEAILVEITNPFQKNHVWDDWTNPNFKKIHVKWQDCVKVGRIMKEFVEEQRQRLTPIEFKILYDAEFPEDTEDTLIRWEWIQNALNRDLTEKVTKGKIIAGLDVAERGTDWSVLTIAKNNGNYYKIIDIFHWSKMDTMPLVGQVISKLKEFGVDEIRVDAIGVGKGVFDRLEELRAEGKISCKVEGIKVSKAPEVEKDRFLNEKAQFYWRLRNLFEDGLIQLIKNNDQIHQLSKMRYELTSGGKIKIIDPEDKSPDFADSLMMCVAVTEFLKERWGLLPKDLEDELNKYVF